ncbi:MAG TPA: hypothetical protein VNF92_06920 [Gemmatimonadaceae bacterium]|nr:hypothetical protein [Phycisphaerae bacterium]HVA57602.1 hypothetical protein [Gemmatimonadaceae bacterium]
MAGDAIAWCAAHGYTDQGNVLNRMGDHIADLAEQDTRRGFVVFEPAVDGLDDEGEEWAGPLVCEAFAFPDASVIAIVPYGWRALTPADMTKQYAHFM